MEFLAYLGRNPAVRRQIRAKPGKTLLYCGSRGATIGHRFGIQSAMWRELMLLKARDPQYMDKEILHDVLARTPAPHTPFRTLLQYVQHVEQQVDAGPHADRNKDVLWRAVSGIFAANAEGPVSFALGSGITDKKVFAATELWVLLRNPKIDAQTRDVLAYYERCIRSGETSINLSVIRA